MRALALAAAVTVLLGGCAAATSGAPPASVQSAGKPGAAASVPSSSPSPTPTVPASPLTGLPQDTPCPVLVVKLDNTRRAQPHAGLNRADVVYLEEVEYGITRIAAVFCSTVPDRIGPVRSARITDLDLLSQYGTPGFAYSGAQRKLLPRIAESGLIDVSPVTNARGYWRQDGRYAPYDLFVNGRTALLQAPEASTDRDLGWVFDPVAPAGGRPATRASMEWRESTADFVYDADRGSYRVRFDGQRARAEEDDAGQHAATVIIQEVVQRPSIYFDKFGANTPHAQTIGSGTATVLRDGQAWAVTWNRPDADSGTRFTMADGTPMPFKPGQQWVVLLNRKTPAVITGPKPSPSVTASATTSAG